MCTGVEIRSCGNGVGGSAAGGRVLGLREDGRLPRCCGLLVENQRRTLISHNPNPNPSPSSCCCNLHVCHCGWERLDQTVWTGASGPERLDWIIRTGVSGLESDCSMRDSPSPGRKDDIRRELKSAWPLMLTRTLCGYQIGRAHV